MRYKVFDPESKVIGQVMLGFKAAADQAMIQPLLEKYGLTDIQLDQWYPLQAWLDVLSDISEHGSNYASMITFVNIGQKVAESIRSPVVEEFINKHGLLDFLASDMNHFAYHQVNHQGNVGITIHKKIDDSHLQSEINTPYPPDFWYGIAYGLARRFITKPFIVHYEDLAMQHSEPGKTVVIHLIVE